MAKTAFDIAVDFVLRPDIEGEHSNNPNDKGGDTWFGISRKYHPDIPWPPTKEQAIAIYKAEYWSHRNLDLDKMKSLPVQMVLFDAAVQHDPTDAAIMFQATLNSLGGEQRILVDGWVGKNTRAKFNLVAGWDREQELLVAEALLWTRAKYYRELAKESGQLKNLRGWIGRIATLGEVLIQQQLGKL